MTFVARQKTPCHTLEYSNSKQMDKSLDLNNHCVCRSFYSRPPPPPPPPPPPKKKKKKKSCSNTYRLFLVSAVEPFLLLPSSTTLRQLELKVAPIHTSTGNNTHRRKPWLTTSVERLPTACMEKGRGMYTGEQSPMTTLKLYSIRMIQYSTETLAVPNSTGILLFNTSLTPRPPPSF